MQKGYREKEYAEWDRARFIAHSFYLFVPFTGNDKETDRRKFFPLELDKEFNKQDRKSRPHPVRLTKEEVNKLNNIFDGNAGTNLD